MLVYGKICACLLNRKPSFLAGPEWITTPWEIHPKSLLDQLLDIAVLLPSLFARADRVLLLDPTLQRRLMAQDLLGNFLGLERQLDEWYGGAVSEARQGRHGAAFWMGDPDPTGGAPPIPFAETPVSYTHLTLPTKA